MTALIIILAIILFFAILLNIPFRIFVSYLDKTPDIYVKYLFFRKTILPKAEKEKKKKDKPEKKSKKDKKEEKSDDATEEKTKKGIMPEKTSERIQFIINILKASGKALRAITKRIKVRKLCVDIDISDEDACDCAVKFGRMNMAVWNIYSFASQFLSIKKDHIRINCVYNKPESVYNFSLIVKVTPAAAILTAFAFIFSFLVNTIKGKIKAKKNKLQESQ